MKKAVKKSPKRDAPKQRRSFSISGVADGGTGQKLVPAITNIWIQGWKSISNRVPLRLNELTVLAGANSSGKSSFFQPILMLKQTLEAPYDPGALLLDGPHVRFTEAAQFLSHCDKGANFADLIVGIETSNYLIESTYAKSAGKPIEIVKETFGKPESFTIEPSMSSSELRKQLGDEGSEFVQMLSRDAKDATITVKRNRCFLSVQLAVDRGDGQKYSLMIESGQTAEVSQAIRSIIHLPGLRGNPARTYPLNATEGLYPGPFQSYTASLIQRWKDLPEGNELKALNKSLAELDLTSEITTTSVDETRVEIKVGRLLKSKAGDSVSIADVGLAVSQVLPVLTALVVAGPGQLIFVEQPELHLHPRAQVKLAQIMADAVNRGVRILLETHSSLLILGIQIAIAEKKLDAAKVSLNWFSRNEDGATEVRQADIDAAGGFGDWPEDFDDVTFDAESKYLTAAEKILMAGEDAK